MFLNRLLLKFLFSSVFLFIVGCQNPALVKSDPPPSTANADVTNASLSTKKPTLSTDIDAQDLTPEINDIWDRIRAGYKLNVGEVSDFGNKRIDFYTTIAERYPQTMYKKTERAGKYLFYIIEELEKNNIPSELALLPFVESSYDPYAYSSGRASGLWQFIPGTGKRFKLQNNWWVDERRDVVASTQAAINYLTYLNNFFDGDWLLTLAAYNAGEGTVKRAIRKNTKLGKKTDYWSLPLPKETRNYVPKLFAWKKVVANPEDYKVSLAAIENKPYFKAVDVGSQIDLATFAELSEMHIDDLYALNPGYNRWATDPKAPHSLLVPLAKWDTAQAGLADYPIDQRMQWEHYKIKSGDTLSTIAERFSTSVSAIKSVNNMRSSRIRAGRTLLIPKASRNNQFYSRSTEQRLAKRQNSTSAQQQKVVHRVRSGETLWSIAKKYSVSVSRLAYWNNMVGKDTLRINQQLVIWVNNGNKVSTATPSTASPITRKVRYKVRNGDSLSRIASKFSVSIDNIRDWNQQLSEKKYLQPGQVLTLILAIR